MDGSINQWGYGRYKHKGKTRLAHRYVYEALNNHIPADRQIDHLCRVRNCVNPAHLEVVTSRENVLRGNAITAINSKKTHCIHGHELSGENLFIRRDGRRRCQVCERESQKRVRSTDKAKARHAELERERRVKRKTSKLG